MSTGACGIDCDACRLRRIGVCSTCGPGNSEEARKKMAAQERILGSPCPILECAVRNGVDYCLQDCDSFPCEILRGGPYPFSERFLAMQERRRQETPQGRSPLNQKIQVPLQYWEDLAQRPLEQVCRNARAEIRPGGGVLLPFLNEPYLVKPGDRSVRRPKGGDWERVAYPLLELILLVYLLGARDEDLTHELITVQQLKDAHFFQGPHALNTAPVLERFGRDVEGFRRAGRALGGHSLDMADVGFRFQALPRVPVYGLLWEGDDEFEPRFSVLFDRSIEKHLSADAIWGLVTLVGLALIQAEDVRPSALES